MPEKIWLSSPHMGGDEEKFVNEAFETNWIAPLGPNVDNFEADLCSFTDSKNAAALSSGTAAIHLALIMLGIKSGDEVICSTFTFSASANPIAYQNAIPIFIDSEVSTWNMSPFFLEEAIKSRLEIGKKPKAIILVHLYGMPSKMDELIQIANYYKIPIIEDAAEALGASYHGKAMGSFGKIGVFSFNGNKIITTSGGGALMSDDKELVVKARFLATQARDDAPHYQHSEIGFNYRMSNICAGIGRGQMMVIKERVLQRRRNYDFYVSALSSFEEIEFVAEPEGFFSNRWLSCILLKSFEQREKVRLALLDENIESRPLWKPLHLQPIFSDSPFYGDGLSENYFERGLCLPSSSSLTIEELQLVSSTIIRVLNGF